MKEIKLIIFTCFIFSLNLLFSQEYVPFKEGDFWGIKYKESVFVEPIFDEIYQDKEAKTIFHTKKGNLFGLIDFDYSTMEIKPISKTELKYLGYANFVFLYYENYYSYLDKNDKKMFINSKGEFILNCNPETLFAKKEGKFYYLFGLDSLGSKNKPIKALDTKYSYLEQSKIKSTFIAQDLNKKFGLVNCIGNVLLPFEYNSVDFFDYDGDGNHFILLGAKGKKVLYNFTSSKLVPFYFDDIMKVNTSDYSNLFITLLDGKYGLFCSDGFDVFPNEFDKIFVANAESYDYNKHFVGLKNNKYYAYNVTGNFLGKDNAPFVLKEYDLIHNDFGLIKNGDNYDFYSLTDNSFVKSEKQSEVELEK